MFPQDPLRTKHPVTSHLFSVALFLNMIIIYSYNYNPFQTGLSSHQTPCTFPPFLHRPLPSGRERHWVTRTAFAADSTTWEKQMIVEVNATTIVKKMRTCGRDDCAYNTVYYKFKNSSPLSVWPHHNDELKPVFTWIFIPKHVYLQNSHILLTLSLNYVYMYETLVSKNMTKHNKTSWSQFFYQNNLINILYLFIDLARWFHIRK